MTDAEAAADWRRDGERAAAVSHCAGQPVLVLVLAAADVAERLPGVRNRSER